jgi:hypothetical protein
MVLLLSLVAPVTAVYRSFETAIDMVGVKVGSSY